MSAFRKILVTTGMIALFGISDIPVEAQPDTGSSGWGCNTTAGDPPVVNQNYVNLLGGKGNAEHTVPNISSDFGGKNTSSTASSSGAKHADPASEVEAFANSNGYGVPSNADQSFGGLGSKSQKSMASYGRSSYNSVASSWSGTRTGGGGADGVGGYPDDKNETQDFIGPTPADGDQESKKITFDLPGAGSSSGGGSAGGGTGKTKPFVNDFVKQVVPPEAMNLRQLTGNSVASSGMATAKGQQMGNCPGQSGGQAKSNQNAEKNQGADNLAAMERFHAAAAIEFCKSYLRNFTVEGGNKWNKVRNQLFVPMAFLLLLPGAVLCQVKSIASQGFAVLGEISPFEGIFRAIVATFLIPATYLVVNYGIDVGNAITKSISDSYRSCFGTDMYEDAFCGHIRAFPIRLPEENTGQIENIHTVMFNYFGSTPLARLEGQTLSIKYEDPCAGIYIVPPDRSNEIVPYLVNEERMAFNQINAGFTCAWTILCAVQEAYLYYLWFVGPVMAALWVYPSKQLRDSFPSWIEGVVSICFWNMFWNTTIMLMAAFRGVDDTGTIMFTALNFLAVGSVKFAFDFSGLVKDAGAQAARAGEKAAQAAAAAAKQGGGGGGDKGGGGGDKGGAKDGAKSGADKPGSGNATPSGGNAPPPPAEDTTRGVMTSLPPSAPTPTPTTTPSNVATPTSGTNGNFSENGHNAAALSTALGLAAFHATKALGHMHTAGIHAPGLHPTGGGAFGTAGGSGGTFGAGSVSIDSVSEGLDASTMTSMGLLGAGLPSDPNSPMGQMGAADKALVSTLKAQDSPGDTRSAAEKKTERDAAIAAWHQTHKGHLDALGGPNNGHVAGGHHATAAASHNAMHQSLLHANGGHPATNVNHAVDINVDHGDTHHNSNPIVSGGPLNAGGAYYARSGGGSDDNGPPLPSGQNPLVAGLVDNSSPAGPPMTTPTPITPTSVASANFTAAADNTYLRTTLDTSANILGTGALGPNGPNGPNNGPNNGLASLGGTNTLPNAGDMARDNTYNSIAQGALAGLTGVSGTPNVLPGTPATTETFQLRSASGPDQVVSLGTGMSGAAGVGTGTGTGMDGAPPVRTLNDHLKEGLGNWEKAVTAPTAMGLTAANASMALGDALGNQVPGSSGVAPPTGTSVASNNPTIIDVPGGPGNQRIELTGAVGAAGAAAAGGLFGAASGASNSLAKATGEPNAADAIRQSTFADMSKSFMPPDPSTVAKGHPADGGGSSYGSSSGSTISGIAAAGTPGSGDNTLARGDSSSVTRTNPTAPDTVVTRSASDPGAAGGFMGGGTTEGQPPRSGNDFNTALTKGYGDWENKVTAPTEMGLAKADAGRSLQDSVTGMPSTGTSGSAPPVGDSASTGSSIVSSGSTGASSSYGAPSDGGINIASAGAGGSRIEYSASTEGRSGGQPTEFGKSANQPMNEADRQRMENFGEMAKTFMPPDPSTVAKGHPAESSGGYGAPGGAYGSTLSRDSSSSLPSGAPGTGSGSSSGPVVGGPSGSDTAPPIGSSSTSSSGSFASGGSTGYTTTSIQGGSSTNDSSSNLGSSQSSNGMPSDAFNRMLATGYKDWENAATAPQSLDLSQAEASKSLQESVTGTPLMRQQPPEGGDNSPAQGSAQSYSTGGSGEAGTFTTASNVTPATYGSADSSPAPSGYTQANNTGNATESVYTTTEQSSRTVSSDTQQSQRPDQPMTEADRARAQTFGDMANTFMPLKPGQTGHTDSASGYALPAAPQQANAQGLTPSNSLPARSAAEAGAVSAAQGQHGQHPAQPPLALPIPIMSDARSAIIARLNQRSVKVQNKATTKQKKSDGAKPSTGPASKGWTPNIGMPPASTPGAQAAKTTRSMNDWTEHLSSESVRRRYRAQKRQTTAEREQDFQNLKKLQQPTESGWIF